MRVGLVGCGAICRAYLDNAPGLDAVEIVACADLDPARAERIAAEYGIEARETDALIASVDVVLCLTPPDGHAEIARRAIAAGRHFYTEKPLATSVADARATLDAAAHANVLVGCAPDTFLGAGVQTLKHALPRIGTPAVAQIRMLASPPERWHPSPAFLYAELAGPLLDLGPYGVATAIELFGPVRNVAALAAGPRHEGVRPAGATFPIVEPTRVSAVLEHDAGVLTTLTTSFDADGPAHHGVEIHGSDGTLLGGDPNDFDGPVILRRHGHGDEPLDLVPGRSDEARGIGLEDLCRAIRDGTPQRTSGALGLHVLAVLLAIRDAAREGSGTRGAGPSAEGSAQRKSPFAVGDDGELVTGPRALHLFPPAIPFKRSTR